MTTFSRILCIAVPMLALLAAACSDFSTMRTSGAITPTAPNLNNPYATDPLDPNMNPPYLRDVH